MLRSLRSRMIVASMLWTAGLLGVMHMISLALMHVPVQIRAGGHLPLVGGVILMAVGLFGLRSGLTPFRQLRARLTEVRAGQEQRVKGEYPTEVQPLIDELNALLADREKAVERALATAGDLAHGLKTPMAVLAQDAARAADAGNTELADGITQQVERMRRQVDYHLARARAAALGDSPAARCSVAASVEGLVRTLLKLYAGRALRIEAAIAPEFVVRVRREDLDEMLGNLLDNACKWSKGCIHVKAAVAAGAVVISVDDDGPGLPPALRTAVLQRGVRADEAAPGCGLGLAIVRDLAEVYQGSVTLGKSELGGLRAQLKLPGSGPLSGSARL